MITWGYTIMEHPVNQPEERDDISGFEHCSDVDFEVFCAWDWVLVLTEVALALARNRPAPPLKTLKLSICSLPSAVQSPLDPPGPWVVGTGSSSSIFHFVTVVTIISIIVIRAHEQSAVQHK